MTKVLSAYDIAARRGNTNLEVLQKCGFLVRINKLVMLKFELFNTCQEVRFFCHYQSFVS